MSHTIEYNRQFIRSELGITPCWLCGDSNVTEMHWTGGRYVERRTRDWCVFCNLLGVTEDDIMGKLHSFCGGPYQEHWTRGGKYLDDTAILRWGKSGCQSAASIEDVLNANNITGVQCYISVWTGALGNRQELSSRIETTKDLDEWITRVKQYIAENPDMSVYPIISFPRDSFTRPSTKPKDASPDDKVILKHGRDGYVVKAVISDGRAGSLYFDRDPRLAAVMKRNEAEAIIRGWRRSGLRAVSATVKDKPNNVVIRFGPETDIAGNYYVSSSGRGFRYTSDAKYAKRFADKSAANRVVNRLTKYSPEILEV